MSKNISLVLWQGESAFDAKPIMVIATGLGRKSKNVKTGDMIQTWILRSDIYPIEAVCTGDDFSICGDCNHRIGQNRSCYVNLRSPINIWNKYERGDCEDFNMDKHFRFFNNRSIRFGSYGDPVAVPFYVWEMLIPIVKSWTGYTNSWHKRGTDKRFKKIIMASVSSKQDQNKARSKGWRTFRIMPILNQKILQNEVQCPASAEMGKQTTCNKCLLCNGKTGKHKNVAIVVHGPARKRFKETYIN